MVEGKHLTMFPRGDKSSLLVLKAGFSSSVQATRTNTPRHSYLGGKWSVVTLYEVVISHTIDNKDGGVNCQQLRSAYCRTGTVKTPLKATCHLFPQQL